MADKRVYIGYDQREKIAYDICKFSIERNNQAHNIDVIPLVHTCLRRQGWFNRPWMTDADTGNRRDLIDGKPFSTEFSHSRFLVPALMNYKGWALFMDCDMVVDADLKFLFDQADEQYAVMVVKHNHNPGNVFKMDGQEQAKYYRKNWSSFILWNCGHEANRKLTVDAINTKPGSWLHQFNWLQDHQIGVLGKEYNWIESVSPAVPRPYVVHYSEGGPWFDGYKDVAYADLWWKYYERWRLEEEYEPIMSTITADYGAKK